MRTAPAVKPLLRPRAPLWSPEGPPRGSPPGASRRSSLDGITLLRLDLPSQPERSDQPVALTLASCHRDHTGQVSSTHRPGAHPAHRLMLMLLSDPRISAIALPRSSHLRSTPSSMPVS